MCCAPLAGASTASADLPRKREVAAVLGVRYRKQPNGDINHSPVIALLDERGLVRSRLTKLWSPSDDFARALRDLASR